MSAKPWPTWPLPVLALAQSYFGTVLVTPLREAGAPWSLEQPGLPTAVSVAGLAMLGLAARNCVRLWRVRSREASRGLVAASVMTAVLSAAWAAGPLMIGVGRWWSVVPGTLTAFLILVLVREVRRRAHTGADEATIRRSAATPLQ